MIALLFWSNIASITLAILFAMSATVKAVALEFFVTHLRVLGFGSQSALIGPAVIVGEGALSLGFLLAPGVLPAAGAALFVLSATVVTVVSRLRAGNQPGGCFCFSTHDVSTARLVVRNAAVVLLALIAAKARFSGWQLSPLLVAACLVATTRLAFPALRLASPDTDNVI